MYALGTFVGSVTERTDHANTINHSIGIKLLATVFVDGSPMVRKVTRLNQFLMLKCCALLVFIMPDLIVRLNVGVSCCSSLLSTPV